MASLRDVGVSSAWTRCTTARRRGLARPELGDRQPPRASSLPHQRQAEADHVGRIALDAVDEPAAETVEGEGAGDPQRFAAGQVCRQVVSVRRAEMDCGAAGSTRGGRRRRRAAGSRSGRCTAARTVASTATAAAPRRRIAGLPRSAPSTVQHRIAADHHAVRARCPRSRTLGDGSALASGQRGDDLARAWPSGPCAAMTASSSTPETTTSGSIPAWRNTFRRPGDAEARTTRVICACGSVPPASRAAS